MDKDEQSLAGVSSGFQVYYARGINTFAEMINAWAYLGFIVNRNTAQSRRDYPSFEEMERNHEKFATSSVAVTNGNGFYSVAVGSVDNVVNNSDAYFAAMWFLKPDSTASGAARRVAAALPEAPAEELGKPITTIGIGRTHQSQH
jgi:L-lysine 6-oxidase